MPRVSLRLSEGEADLGGTKIPLQRDPQGALQLGGGDGPKLRTLRFGERGRIVRQALSAPDGVADDGSGAEPPETPEEDPAEPSALPAWAPAPG